jgi:hypothetical protein
LESESGLRLPNSGSLRIPGVIELQKLRGFIAWELFCNKINHFGTGTLDVNKGDTSPFVTSALKLATLRYYGSLTPMQGKLTNNQPPLALSVTY